MGLIILFCVSRTNTLYYRSLKTPIVIWCQDWSQYLSRLSLIYADFVPITLLCHTSVQSLRKSSFVSVMMAQTEQMTYSKWSKDYLTLVSYRKVYDSVHLNVMMFYLETGRLILSILYQRCFLTEDVTKHKLSYECQFALWTNYLPSLEHDVLLVCSMCLENASVDYIEQLLLSSFLVSCCNNSNSLRWAWVII